MKQFLYLLTLSLAFTACNDDEEKPTPTVCPTAPTAYVTRVFDYRPAVGQFVNELPKYEEGDTQDDMNRKALEAIGGQKRSTVTLGGFGGYIIVGFDHAIVNEKGKRDFRILGNAFAGSSEPGVVMVSTDTNNNGLADDEWYELAGSAHQEVLTEPWLDEAKAAGNNVNVYRNYEITYHRPEVETEEERAEYIRWEDNQQHAGYKAKNAYHAQPYFPQWIKEDQMTFRGTCLPQNSIDRSGTGTNYFCHQFRYGYADNAPNNSAGATFDIDWAINAQGEKVALEHIDFIKVYTAVNQENGWIGECSTEIVGVEDLHVLGEDIASTPF